MPCRVNIKQLDVSELGESGKEGIGYRGRAWSSQSSYVLAGRFAEQRDLAR